MELKLPLLLTPGPGPISNELKESTSLNEVKSKIKTWKPENCPCKLCEIYLQGIGYLQVTD